jgi:ribosomal protein S18 acetylase RimI-like enzyme
MNLNIRMADLRTDFQDIAALDTELNGPREPALVREEYENYAGSLFVGWIGPEIVGLTSLSPPFWDRVHMIDHLAVHAKWRGQGIGKRLTGFVIDEARRRACRILTVQTAQWNADAIRFYQAAGFTERIVFPDYIGDGNDMVWLDLDLRG